MRVNDSDLCANVVPQVHATYSTKWSRYLLFQIADLTDSEIKFH